MIVMVLGAVLLDFKLQTKLLTNNRFWFLQIFVLIMTVLYDLLAANTFWVFNKNAIIGLAIYKTPIENILFGVSLVSYTIILYEHFLKNINTQK